MHFLQGPLALKNSTKRYVSGQNTPAKYRREFMSLAEMHTESACLLVVKQSGWYLFVKQSGWYLLTLTSCYLLYRFSLKGEIDGLLVDHSGCVFEMTAGMYVLI